MAILAWKFPRTRLPVGASALCVVVLCWLYIFPVYRLPNEKEIVQGVLQQGTAWRRNQTAARLFRYSCSRGFSPLVSFLPTAPRTGSPVRTASQRHLSCSLSCPTPLPVHSQTADSSQGSFPTPYLKRCADTCFVNVKSLHTCFCPGLICIQRFTDSRWEGEPRQLCPLHLMRIYLWAQQTFEDTGH